METMKAQSWALAQTYIGLIVFLSFSYVFLRFLSWLSNRIHWAYFGPLSKVPGPKLGALTRGLMQLKQVTGRRWRWVQFELLPTYGPVIRLGPNDVLISDRDSIKKFLTSHDITKSVNYLRFRRDVKEETLFTATNIEFHKQRRRLLSPAFSIKYLASLEPLIHSCVRDLLVKIDTYVAQSTPGIEAVVDCCGLIQSCALDIIGATAFGGSFNMVNTGKGSALVQDIFQGIRRRVLRTAFPILKPFVPDDVKVTNYTTGLIKQRRQKNSPSKDDILQIMLNCESQSKLTNIQVTEQLLEFIVAGTDTTGFIMSMTLILLARNPEKLRKLIKELDAALPPIDLDNLPKNDALKNLPYLNAVLNETMRLWPAGLDAGTSRAAPNDCILAGYVIPEGTSVIMNFYHLHHSVDYWGNDAEEFVPERWLEPEKLPRDCFYPFSAGARNCIGQNFALLEMRVVLVTLIRRYIIENVKGQDLNVIQYITPSLMPKEYKFLVSRRNS